MGIVTESWPVLREGMGIKQNPGRSKEGIGIEHNPGPFKEGNGY